MSVTTKLSHCLYTTVSPVDAIYYVTVGPNYNVVHIEMLYTVHTFTERAVMQWTNMPIQNGSNIIQAAISLQ